MRVIQVAVAAVAAFLVASCGAAPSSQQGIAPDRVAPVKDNVSRSTQDAVFGERHELSSGLGVTLTPPRSLTPSDTAYPAAARAAVFQLTIDNNTTLSYKPSQFIVRASLDGKSTEEVVDPAQGLNGLVSAAQDIPSGKSVTLTLAFAMPIEKSSLRISIQVDATKSGPTVTYQGTS